MSWDMGILSSFPLYTYLKICSCWPLLLWRTPTLWGAAWSLPTSWSLADKWTTLLQDGMDYYDSNHQVIWIVPYFCQRLEMWLRSQVWNASYLDQSMLDLAFCWRWSCPPPTLAPWKLEGQGRLRLGKPQLCQAQLVCEEKRDCQGEARLWTRTLVCDDLDAYWVFPIAFLGFLKYYLLYKCFQLWTCFPICSNFLSPECYISQLVQCNVVFGRAATRQC